MGMIHLCFGEYGDDKVSYAIRSIDLSDFWSYSSRKWLHRVGEFSGHDLPRHMGCGAYGSRIVFAGGVKGRFQPLINRMDAQPFNEIRCFQTLRPTKPFRRMPDFMEGKAQPLLVVLNKKLYALGKPECCPTNPYFEVYNPVNKIWNKLEDPPFLCDDSDLPTSKLISHAIAGNNILVSNTKVTFRYDTNDPEKGWRTVKLSNGGLFSFQGKTLVVDDGQEYVLFVYGTADYCYYRKILVYLISYDFESSVYKHSLVSLPESVLPNEFLLRPPTSYNFLHLGDGKVCLFWCRQEKEKVCVLPIVFEFEVKPKDKTTQRYESKSLSSLNKKPLINWKPESLRTMKSKSLNISFLGFMSTMLQYETNNGSDACDTEMLGAYLLQHA